MLKLAWIISVSVSLRLVQPAPVSLSLEPVQALHASDAHIHLPLSVPLNSHFTFVFHRATRSLFRRVRPPPSLHCCTMTNVPLRTKRNAESVIVQHNLIHLRCSFALCIFPHLSCHSNCSAACIYFNCQTSTKASNSTHSEVMKTFLETMRHNN